MSAIDDQIQELQKRLTQLKKRKAEERLRMRKLQKKKQLAAHQVWGMAVEQKLKKETDPQKRAETHAFIKALIDEAHPIKKGRSYLGAIKHLDDVMVEATKNQEIAPDEKPAKTEPTGSSGVLQQ